MGRKQNADNEAELIMDLVKRGGAQMVFHKMNEEDVERILKYPNTMIASDAGPIKMGENMPHPRGYGSNARVLGRYVREKKTITLEDAIRRMTALPAQRFNIKDRGQIKEGMAADILVFDPEKIQDKATFEKPHAYSEGIDLVIINGRIVMKDNKMTGVKSGVILYGAGKE